MRTITAFGNPLLDTTIYITNDDILKKYNLKKDGAKEISENEMQALMEDISGFNQSLSAGGCAQNTLRVFQWLMQRECNAFIFGSVGKDRHHILLKKLIENDGVQTRYIQQSDFLTGTTVALINGLNRSLVANVGAAENLPLTSLVAQKDFVPLVETSDVVYVEGFFLTNRLETSKYIADFCNQHNKIIAFNISGEYMCEEYPDMVKYFVEHSDIVFGNKREYEALCKVLNVADVKTLTRNIIANGKHKLFNYGNIVVITDNDKVITCVYSGGVEEIDVPPINQKDVIDTTGAGDAFVAGFICGIFLKKTIRQCSEIGCYAASNIIKQTGCTLPQFKANLDTFL